MKTNMEIMQELLTYLQMSGKKLAENIGTSPTHIYNIIAGRYTLTKETSDNLTIELNKYTTAILDKYKDDDSPLALPVISNVKMNEHLKRLGKIAEIDEQIRQVYFVGSNRFEKVQPKYELLTTHCGRRSFVVNAIYLGISPEVIMKWTGHSDYESMKPYIDIVDKLKRQEMNKFNR